MRLATRLAFCLFSLFATLPISWACTCVRADKDMVNRSEVVFSYRVIGVSSLADSTYIGIPGFPNLQEFEVENRTAYLVEVLQVYTRPRLVSIPRLIVLDSPSNPSACGVDVPLNYVGLLKVSWRGSFDRQARTLKVTICDSMGPLTVESHEFALGLVRRN